MEVQPKKNANFILWNCQVMLIFIWKAWKSGLLDFCLMYFSIYITSILHWYHPIQNSRRQQLDRGVVNTWILYTLIQSWRSSYIQFVWYLVGISLAGYFYHKAKQNDHQKDISMKWHLCMHYTGHFTNAKIFFINK